jgi:hypothetical protein
MPQNTNWLPSVHFKFYFIDKKIENEMTKKSKWNNHKFFCFILLCEISSDITNPEKKNWREIIPESKRDVLDSIDIVNNNIFIVVWIRDVVVSTDKGLICFKMLFVFFFFEFWNNKKKNLNNVRMWSVTKCQLLTDIQLIF